MRIGMIFVIAMVTLTGCAHLELKNNIVALKQIQPGDSQAAAFEILGPPDLRTDINEQRFVAHYQTKAGESSAAPVTPALCTPVAFENGQVVAIGEDLTAIWTQEEEEKQRQARIAERKRQRIKMARAAQQQAEITRQQRIKALEKEVAPIPASQAGLNLTLYRKLLELDPGNSRYRKKVAYYEARLAQQEEIQTGARQQRLARIAKEKRRRTWEQNRDARNNKLRQYTGNGIAEVAVHDISNGSLYVWVKNVSDQIITTHPDHFTLVDSDGNPAACQISNNLESVLEPGSISHGKIRYDEEIEPKEMIFQNRESGRISKSFQ